MLGFPSDRCYPVNFPFPWLRRTWDGEESREMDIGDSPAARNARPTSSSSAQYQTRPNEEERAKSLEAKKKKIGVKSVKTCRLCFEPGAYKRPCCKGLFCDHCYVKNRRCPNCNVQTKQEALTGATYQLKVFSEHEECRVCLDPGIPRRCCNNYYCDTCFYKAPLCRSCGTPVSKIGEVKEITQDAHCVTVCLGWTLSIFITVVLLVFIGIIIAAEQQMPVTVFDYRCYGFFRKCETSRKLISMFIVVFHCITHSVSSLVCASMPAQVATGDIPLPALSDWTKCKLDSEYKLQSKICIFDQNLYHQSDRLLGYDVCEDKFNEGVYVFEDLFEHWQNESFRSSTMKSAKWGHIYNGFANQFCGATSEPGFRGDKALSFRGVDHRYAETIDLDVRSGGRVEAFMFLPPVGFDVANPLCKTGYIGTVNVEYSTNEGRNWTLIYAYDPSIYRQTQWFKVQLEIPEEASTSKTRFRFDQPVFEMARDNWALDNVRILRYLPGDWRESKGFMANLQKAHSWIQRAQCCVDTDWCKQRFTAEEKDKQCPISFPDWYTRDRPSLFRLSEIILCITALLNLVRFVYYSAFDYLVFHRLPFHDELVELFEIPLFVHYYKKIPFAYRPPRVTPDPFTQNIHKTARLEAKLRDEYDDGEADGEYMKRKEIAEEEKAAYMKKVKKEKKKLAKRMKARNFQGSSIVVPEDKAYEDHLQTYVLPFEKEPGTYELGNTVYAEDKLPDDLDRFRRQDVALLRVPIEVDTDYQFRKTFAIVVLGVFAVMFLFELSYTPYFELYEPLQSFGAVNSVLRIDSVFVVFLAAWCDFKEILHVLKYNIPLRDKWLPTVTIDLSDDVKSMVVNQYAVPLENVREITAFNESFVHLLVAGFSIALFPWCLFALLMREVALDYSAMRFVTPLLGTVMIVRAVLGPSFLIKMAFALQHFFEYHFPVREAIGSALKSESTLNLALNAAFGMALSACFITILVDMQHAGVVFGCGIIGGAFYGLFTGAAHDLPIKPWLCKSLSDCLLFAFTYHKVSLFTDITMMRSGMFMRVRKKQRCPCVYWGKYCTDVHNFEEVFVLYTTDEPRLTSFLTRGVQDDQKV